MTYFVCWVAGDGCAYREVHEFYNRDLALAFIHERLQPPSSTPLKQLELIEGHKLELEAASVVASVKIKQ